MIEIADFEPHLIGQDANLGLSITKLPGCWHIAESFDPSWALVVTLSFALRQQVTYAHFHIALSVPEEGVQSLAHGGGPSRVAAVELSNRINDILTQFVRD